MKPLRNKTPSRNTIPKTKMNSAKDPVEVFCRIRPSENDTDMVCLKLVNKTTVQLLPPDFLTQRNGSNEQNALGLEYTFRYVFDNTDSQKELFDHCALPLVEDLIRGKNGLIFTYGVTSSGKTFTMTGMPQDCGLLPRCFDVLFNSIGEYQANKYIFKPDKMNGYELQSAADAMLEVQRENGQSALKTPKQKRRAQMVEWALRDTDGTKVGGIDTDSAYAVFVSYIEIYNNHIFDLLEEVNIDMIKEKLQSKILRTDSRSNMYVFGTTEVEVKSAEEAFEVFWKGQQRRRVAHTALNTESSRSHSVFTMRLVQAPLDARGVELVGDKSYVNISQLSLVDLAGSERTQRTKNTGNRLKEAGNINNSLMVLRQCIEILREKQNNPLLTAKMVPYRDNKLTLLFKSFFEGEGRVRMIVCAHPGMDEYDETLQVMKFAEITQEVMIARPQDIKFTRGRRDMPPLASEFKRVSFGFPYTMGPPLPDMENLPFDDPACDIMLENTLQCLLAKHSKRTEMLLTLSDGQTQIRNNFMELHRENNETKPHLMTVQMDLEAREHQLKTLERRLAASEQSNDGLRKRLSDYELKKRTMQHQLSEKDYLLNKGVAERVKIANQMEDRIEMERDRMRRVMEHRLAMKQAELEGKMCLTQEKFAILREILNSGDWPIPDNLRLDDFYGPPKSTSSEPDLINLATPVRKGGVTGVVPVSNQKRMLERGRKEKGVMVGRGIPTSNPRHRRSMSADVWIEHKPVGSVETGTVFQPRFNRRKSVTKLDQKDIVKDADKYVLTHQEQDSGGDLETQLYKGDIIPSAGGGAQVIFNDVEVLRQSSPPSPRYSLRKRSSGGLNKSEIEARCQVGLECKTPIPNKKQRS